MKSVTLFLISLAFVTALVPPRFQWKTIDYDWECLSKDEAIASGDYVPENNMPAGLARWKDKLFITVPRWKPGVPATLNYINVSGPQSQPLKPYPSWGEAYLARDATCVTSNATVVSTFRVHVDRCDRLWVIDNGVADMFTEVRQIVEPVIIVFDLKTDTVVHRFTIPSEMLTDSSVLTSIVAEIPTKGCERGHAYAYITDMGSNALIVYSLHHNDAWRIEHPYFNFDPHAGVFKVGGIEFFWNDGVSSATLAKSGKEGYSDLYLHPTSSTRQFKVSTKYLRNKNIPQDELFDAVEIVGNRGPNTQATACDFDPKTNVLFYTQLSKNGVGCWNTDKPFNGDTVQLIISDCNLLEFPNDIKVDQEGNLWVLSNRQSRFLYESMDFDAINFRILSAPVPNVVKGTACDKGKYKKKKSK